MSFEAYNELIRRRHSAECKKFRSAEIMRRCLNVLEEMIVTRETFSYKMMASRIHLCDVTFYKWFTAQPELVRLVWRYKKYTCNKVI